MPNSKIPYTNLTDNINLHRLRHNQLIDSVGDVSSTSLRIGWLGVNLGISPLLLFLII